MVENYAVVDFAHLLFYVVIFSPRLLTRQKTQKQTSLSNSESQKNLSIIQSFVANNIWRLTKVDVFCFFFVCNEWVKYLEIRIISIKVIPWIIGTVGECTSHLRNWSEEWQCFMSAYCQVWDARWYMPGHALSSAQDGFFLRFTAASLMIQTAEVLGSSQVCFTQHTYPKFSPVKKRN